MNKSLEEILKEEKILKKNNKGKNIITNNERAFELYKNYLNNTGIVNRVLLKGHKFLKDKKFNKFADKFISIYICGSMTQKDQEAFALIYNEKAWKLTMKNAALVTLMAPQYYGHVKLASTIPYLLGLEVDAESASIGLASSIAIANLARMGVSYKTKKAYAAISLDGLFLNGTTYLKNFNKILK